MRTIAMYPKRECPRCHRRIAINFDGQQRAHFCLHWRSYEAGQCEECAKQFEHSRADVEGDVDGAWTTDPLPAA